MGDLAPLLPERKRTIKTMIIHLTKDKQWPSVFPKPHPKAKRLGRRAVTIVAGFKCADGIVLCADTEETFGNAKTRVPKLQMCYSSNTDHADDLMLALAGAGNGPWVDKLIELAWAKVQTATSFEEACQFAEKAIKDAHEEFGRIFQPGSMPDAKLVYGIKMDSKTKLFSSDGPLVNEQKHFAVHGCGDELGTYICNLMCPSWSHHSLSQLAVLAAYIVYQAKTYVPGVGGSTHLGILRNGGGSSADFGNSDKWMEQHFDYLDGFLGPAFLASFDIDTPDFLSDAHLSELVDMLKLGRQEMKDWRQKALDFVKAGQELMDKQNRANYPWRYRKEAQQ